MGCAIVVDCLSKSYGKVSAVRSVSFRVNEGEIYGLIGPDGAGKTSIFRMLTTLLLPDEGSAQVCGFDICKDCFEIRKIVGYMPGRFSLYQDLSVEENLDFFATMFGTSVAENYETIRDIYSQLEPFKSRKAGKLSGGMKQKLALCCALVHKPKVLFLDEPTTGVDAVSRKEFWTMLERIRESGVTIFVSTPYMDEAALCDRISLIRQGQIIECGTPEQIVQGFPYSLLSVRSAHLPKLLKVLRDMDGVLSCFSFGDSLHVAYDEEVTSMKKIVEYAQSRGFADCVAEHISAGIEDRFMQLAMEVR